MEDSSGGVRSYGIMILKMWERNNWAGKNATACSMNDTYDFTEITTLMGSEMNASLGTIANDAAVISQDRGAIQPYSISISVDIWRDL